MFSKAATTALATTALIVSAGTAQAKEVFGFNLGETTISQAATILNDAGASASAPQTYRGYPDEFAPQALRVIGDYPPFDKVGPVKASSLEFNSEKNGGKLYRVAVTWEHDYKQKTGKKLKDALETKYGAPVESKERGFNKDYAWRINQTTVAILNIDTHMDDDATLSYVQTALADKAKEQIAVVEGKIKAKNADSLANDL